MTMSSFYSEPATKADVRRVAIEVVNVQADVREVKKNMATRKDIERVLGAIESLSAKTETAMRAIVLHGQVLTEVQVKSKDHERRIKSLEVRSAQ